MDSWRVLRLPLLSALDLEEASRRRSMALKPTLRGPLLMLLLLLLVVMVLLLLLLVVVHSTVVGQGVSSSSI